jgi:hypothetical protein
MQKVEQQILDNGRGSSGHFHTRLEQKQQLVGATNAGDPKGANLSKGTKHKRDHSGTTVEPVVVALGAGDGNRLGDIRPKRPDIFLRGPSGSVEPLHNRFWGWVLVRVK